MGGIQSLEGLGQLSVVYHASLGQPEESYAELSPTLELHMCNI